MRVCVGAWLKCLFALLGVDNVNMAPPDGKFFKWSGVRDVLVLVPSNQRGYTKMPVD